MPDRATLNSEFTVGDGAPAPADPAAHEERLRWVLDRLPDSEAVSMTRGDIQDVRAVLAALDAARADVERLTEDAAEALVRQAKLRGMTVEEGVAELNLESPREIVLAWVWAAREMLGDAPNYTETPVEFPRESVSMEVKAAFEVDRYVFTVQRAGRVTPHEARMAAEAERDEARAEVERLRGLWPTNGLGEETNVHQLVANHRAWTRQAWKVRDEALAEREAARARAAEMEQRYDRLTLDVQRLTAEKAEAWAAGERLAAKIDAALAAVDALAADANGWAPEPAAAMDEHATAIREALGATDA